MQQPNSLEELPRECLITVLQGVGILDWRSLSVTSKFFNKLIKDDFLWKSLALNKWGPALEALAAPRVQNGGWLAYCSHRMNLTAAPKSPLDLGQEQFPDPWSHLVCCILCSRTTGGPVIRSTIKHFISCWPTPSAVLAAAEGDLAAAINPLGLQLNRIKALKSMSHDFLANDWQLPSEFSGCGKFTSDSWRIFCRGHRSLEDVEDKNLRRYLHWLLNNDIQKPKEKSEKLIDSSKKESREKVKDGKVAKKKTSKNGTGKGNSCTIRRKKSRGIRNNLHGGTRRQTRSNSKE